MFAEVWIESTSLAAVRVLAYTCMALVDENRASPAVTLLSRLGHGCLLVKRWTANLRCACWAEGLRAERRTGSVVLFAWLC
jgi:hypothetical protein